MSQSIENADQGLDEAFFRGEAADFRGLFEGGELSESWKLAEASGLTDPALVDRLVGLGIRPSTLAALTLVPLIEVAWSDGHMDQREREAILSAAESTGLDPASPSHRLLEIWTFERPAPALVSAWHDFVREIVGEFDADERSRFQARLMDRAHDVAEAAGGLLGLTSKVSRSERAAMERLGGAFRD